MGELLWRGSGEWMILGEGCGKERLAELEKKEKVLGIALEGLTLGRWQL